PGIRGRFSWQRRRSRIGRDGGQVRRLFETARERNRTDAQSRTPKDPGGLPLRTSAWSLSGSRAEAVAGQAGPNRPPASHPRCHAGRRRGAGRLRWPARPVSESSGSSLEARIAGQLASVGLRLERPTAQLAAYVQLLIKWNRSMNLTALSLNP